MGFPWVAFLQCIFVCCGAFQNAPAEDFIKVDIDDDLMDQERLFARRASLGDEDDEDTGGAHDWILDVEGPGLLAQDAPNSNDVYSENAHDEAAVGAPVLAAEDGDETAAESASAHAEAAVGAEAPVSTARNDAETRLQQARVNLIRVEAPPAVAQAGASATAIPKRFGEPLKDASSRVLKDLPPSRHMDTKALLASVNLGDDYRKRAAALVVMSGADQQNVKQAVLDRFRDAPREVLVQKYENSDEETRFGS